MNNKSFVLCLVTLVLCGCPAAGDQGASPTVTGPDGFWVQLTDANTGVLVTVPRQASPPILQLSYAPSAERAQESGRVEIDLIGAIRLANHTEENERYVIEDVTDSGTFAGALDLDLGDITFPASVRGERYDQERCVFVRVPELGIRLRLQRADLSDYLCPQPTQETSSAP